VEAVSESLIAPVESTRHAWTGAILPDAIQGLVDAIRSEGWVDDALAGAGLGLEVAGTYIDPFSALLANGLGWAMEYFQPLRQILDSLLGMPDVVNSHAATWDRMAAELQRMAEDLRGHLSRDVPDWQGVSATDYQDLMVNNVEALGGLAGASTAMAAATSGAGNLVMFTRDLVRDLIADLVSRVIVWALEALTVIAIPVVAAQIIAAVVKWTGRVLMYTSALITSLTNLNKLLNG
jgi:uncharacterized protein YukE